MLAITNRADAILWVHETVGDELDGEATLEQCVEWIRRQFQGDQATLRILSHAAAILQTTTESSP